MKKRETIITIIFVILIFAFPLGTLIRNATNKTKEDDSAEREILEGNGTLADNKVDVNDNVSEPKKNKKTYDFLSFRADITSFSDDLIFQDKFVDANAFISYNLSGGTYVESNSVLVGDEGYLFYQVTTDGDPISDYKGTNLFDNPTLLSIANNLVGIRNELASRDIDFYVVVIPNKEQVYDRYMPPVIYRDSEYSRGQQIYDFMVNNTDVHMLYPLKELKEASLTEDIFYKTDTHETEKGAFIVFQEFYKYRYGDAQQYADASFKVTRERYTGDLGHICNVPALQKSDTIVAFEQTNWSWHKPEKILIVGDSFGGYLTNIAGLDYDGAYRVDTAAFTKDMLDKYDPDIVIFETAERRVEVLAQNIMAR